MKIEREAEADLPLDGDVAESVAGGRAVKRQTKQTSHHATAPSANATVAPVVASPLGLDMGPDPAYPNPDGGDDSNC